MKTADLYIRVSTDEQAAKGYSPRSQEEALRRHCETHDVVIRKVIHEDFSAKTFNRPEWKKLIENYRMNSSRPDYILFVKWDRFSRNAPDAYQMIATLNRLKVEPQAIEQPLDLSIPENKMMLAIYLTAPEIENDRRSLNVKHGMHQARKEGRWMGIASPGYLNKTKENGDKYVAIDPVLAPIMVWAFQTLATSQYTTVEVWRLAKAKGLNCSIHSFWKAIRNVGFCGRIFVPEYGKEKAHTVKGQHEALISEALFYQVQDVLDKRRLNIGSNGKRGIRITSLDLLPLRGFLICPFCRRRATGSASKGMFKHQHYYHCQSPCKWRENAKVVNMAFVGLLKLFKPKKGVAEVFQEIVTDLYRNESKYIQIERKELIRGITDCHNRINRARELLLNGTLSDIEYSEIKKETENKLNRLETQLNDASTKTTAEMDYEGTIYKVLENLKKLDLTYLNADISGKRHIISSIFSEKWTFEDGKHRTVKTNEVFLLIYQINKQLENKKSRLRVSKNTQSACVPESRFELPRRCQRQPLKLVRLPISPPGCFCCCKDIFIRIILSIHHGLI